MSNEVAESSTKRKEISVDEGVLKQYTGIYQLAPTFSIKVTFEEGRLYAQASAQPRFQVYPKSKTRFFYKVVEAQLEFIKDEEGNFNKVKLYQSGRVLEGQKVKK